MVRNIPVQEAVGEILAHDITRIAPGEFKGRAFKKGHKIVEEDVPNLMNLGKNTICILDLEQGYVHEDDAALRIATAASGRGIELTEAVEGKVKMVSSCNGLLKVNVKGLHKLNSIEQIVVATLHSNQQVTKDTPVAGTRIIPLFTEEKRVLDVENYCGEFFPVVEVVPFRPVRVGLVTTGSEVYHGRIKDKFGPVVRDKFAAMGSEVFRQIIVPDDVPTIIRSIQELLDQGAEMIICSGGMSVDPDDRTPASIRGVGGEVITYGSPTFPGSMFMLSYLGAVPIIGLPGCAMYHKATIFDLIVPRILAGDRISRDDIVALGHGGYCFSCTECRYPSCSFGKI
ncbi:MAG TPA: molybdopterin-binding protein [Geobacteraceae bacterium]|nr:molybdopterin-binding protein [Geobacteraceae bacterium]